jgi:hypothetical protein
MGVVRVCLTRESLAFIRFVLETELSVLKATGECERDLLYCIAIMDALDELPTIQ